MHSALSWHTYVLYVQYKLNSTDHIPYTDMHYIYRVIINGQNFMVNVYVTGPAKINHVSASYIFTNIFSSECGIPFRKFQKKAH